MTNELPPRSRFLSVTLCALLFGGCAPSLSNEADFLDAAVCPTSMQDQFFVRRCGMEGCHVPFEPTGGLDFVSPDLSTRLVGIESSTCAGELLINPQNPDESFLLNRLSPNPECAGEPVLRMPGDGRHLSEAEMACVRAWVTSLAGGSHVE